MLSLFGAYNLVLRLVDSHISVGASKVVLIWAPRLRLWLIFEKNVSNRTASLREASMKLVILFKEILYHHRKVLSNSNNYGEHRCGKWNNGKLGKFMWLVIRCTARQSCAFFLFSTLINFRGACIRLVAPLEYLSTQNNISPAAMIQQFVHFTCIVKDVRIYISDTLNLNREGHDNEIHCHLESYLNGFSARSSHRGKHMREYCFAFWSFVRTSLIS